MDTKKSKRKQLNMENQYDLTEKQSKRITILKTVFTLFVVYLHSNMVESGIKLNNQIARIDYSKLLEIIRYLISNIICGCVNNGFFFISAFLLYRKKIDYINNIKKKTKSLIIPYIAFNTLYIIIYFVFQTVPITKSFFSSKNIISEFRFKQWLEAYGIGVWGPLDGPTWFLKNLFILNILCILLKKTIDKFPKAFLLILVLNAIFAPTNIFYLIFPDNLLFWSLGYYVVKYNIKIDKFDNVKKRISLIYILIISTLLIIHITNLNIPSTVLNCINLFRDIISIVFWYSCFTYYDSNLIQNTLYRYSKYNMPVFLLHGIAMVFLYKLLMILLPSTPTIVIVEYILVPFIVIILIIIFSFIIKKTLPKIYSFLVGGR